MSFEVVFFLIFAGGWIAGQLTQLLRLPSILGMTLWGIGMGWFWASQNWSWPPGFWDLAPFLKSLALVIILLRAGLGLRLKDLKKAGWSALLMAFVPGILEALVIMGSLIFFMNFPWEVAGLTGFMLAAVSPAVVVPSMLELKSQGLGIRNGVITVILAGASVDDVVAITLFTVFLGFATNVVSNPWLPLIEIPLTLLGGIVLGLIVGLALAWWFKWRNKAIRATEKALLLVASGLVLVQVGDWLHAAALLGVMTLGLVLLERAETVAHEMASKLGKIWIGAQLALFVIIGLSLDISEAINAGPLALFILVLGLLARSTGVLLATWPSTMTMKERLFCVIAYIPKATVQAALGGVALVAGVPQGKTILAFAVLAIIVTAPLGLIGIRLGARLLGEKSTSS